MAWIESHTRIRFHKKLKPLCEKLKVSRPQAIGHLHCLWWWAIENREDGDLNDLYPKDIADAADWEGKPAVFLSALKATGWITKDNQIKDWMDYAGRLVKERVRGRERRKSQDASAERPRTTAVQKELIEEEVPDLHLIWNEICCDLKKVQDLTRKRKEHIKARLKKYPKAEQWRTIFGKIAASSFCSGENDRGWEATFDWIIKNDDNPVKVLEGKYDNRGPKNVRPETQGNQSLSPAARATISRQKRDRTGAGATA